MCPVRRDVLAACFAAVSLYGAYAALGGDCSDPQGACPTPCPAEKSCNSPYGSAEGCPEGLICVPSCLPSWCFCDLEHNSWACSADCAGECYDWPEPTGPPTYTITPLGTLGGVEGIAFGINNYGDIVGEAGALDGKRHAALWTDGQVIDNGPYGGTYALEINNLQQVIINDSTGTRAYLWQDRECVQLPGLNPADSAYAEGINDAGHIVGRTYVYALREHHSCMWQDGIVTDLTEAIGMSVHAVNNLGHYAGAVGPNFSYHAAVWDGMTVTDLGTLGGQVSGAGRINDLGQVIGQSERAPGGDRMFYGFFWDGQRMHDVSEFAGYSVRDLELNNCAEVVFRGTGRSDEALYVYHAGRGLRPVRGVYGPATGWWNLDVRDMNDRGEIVGMGQLPNGLGRAFVIKPIPGDLDWDGDVDLRDLSELSLRFSGPKAPAIPGCERADIDRDADVDLDDLAGFQSALSGPL